MSRTLRIVNYAVNGTGVGHLTRLIAINRWIRRYAVHAGVRPEIYFLTSSEADGLLFGERFASFKLPSKTVVGEAGIDKLAYLALAKQWVWHSLGLIRPDLLIVDTFPRGSFGELLSALDLCRTKAFIYRPSKSAVTLKVDFQAMLPLYDAIVVPEHESEAPVTVPDVARSRLHYSGPVAIRERVELLSRAEARAQLGIAEDRLAVYVSTGGGGDPASEEQLQQVCTVLRNDASVHLVVGAGPLFRGRRLFGERLAWLTQGGAAELMPGFDLAITAAGYNTFTELMLAGVPCLFLPLEKGADDQRARAARAVAAGAGVLLGGCDAASIHGGVERLKDQGLRAAAAEAARRLVPRNHAREAAAELLRLVVPSADVEAAEEAVTDELLGTVKELAVDFDDVLEVIDAVDPRLPERRGRMEASRSSMLAIELLRFVTERRVPVPAAVRVIQLLARKLPPAMPAERAQAIQRTLQAFEPFGDWSGATTMLKIFAVERELTALAFADELAEFLERIRASGGDLYRGMALLSGAQSTGREVVSNRVLLQTAAEEP